jgi:iron(III) transport system substrate-binding protein
LPSLAGTQNDDVGPTISLEPALMTYLDKMKRAAFMREWENALVQGEQNLLP